ncbi:MAG TPA: hypothetical protein VGY54_26065 [Polyangiaceae bacterium]|nr:hypothetical protein [Polyangiaceae bacterium]
MGSSRGAKLANVAGVVVFTLALAAGIGGFTYYKVTSAIEAAKVDPASADVRAQQQARSQMATAEGDDLTTTLGEFVRRVHEGQFDLAQRLAARPYRDSIKPPRFGASVSANPYLKAGGTFVSRHVMLRDDTGRWDGTFQSALGPVTLLADFSREPEGWRLSSLLVGGIQTFPSF